MAKKLLKGFTVLILVGTMLMMVSMHAQASDRLDRLIEEELSKPQVWSVTTTAAVTGIVVGAVGLMGATYQAGRYAARQCEVRLGLTKSQYRANRWTYRAVLSGLVFTGGTTGAIVAFGFDDYYMGFGGRYTYKFIFLCAIASIILGMVTLSVQGGTRPEP